MLCQHAQAPLFSENARSAPPDSKFARDDDDFHISSKRQSRGYTVINQQKLHSFLQHNPPGCVVCTTRTSAVCMQKRWFLFFSITVHCPGFLLSHHHSRACVLHRAAISHGKGKQKLRACFCKSCNSNFPRKCAVNEFLNLYREMS